MLFPNEQKTIVIIDLSVSLHRLHDTVISTDLDKAHYPGVVKAQLAWLLSCQYLEGLVDPEVCWPFLACDQKLSDLTYWRNEYLHLPEVVARVPRRTKADEKRRLRLLELLDSHNYLAGELDTCVEVAKLAGELAIHYKAGRKLPDYAFKKLKTTVYKTLDELGPGMTTLRVPGYEADDLAATVVKMNRDLGSPCNIVLVTVDSDWMGMIGEDVAWFCQHGYDPRVRYCPGSVAEWAGRRLKKSNVTPTDIWGIKAIQGDKSDNLPPGSPIEVIDLFNPPEGKRLWELPHIKGVVNNMLTCHDDSSKIWKDRGLKAKDYLQRLGVPVTVRPFNAGMDLHKPLATKAA